MRTSSLFAVRSQLSTWGRKPDGENIMRMKCEVTVDAVLDLIGNSALRDSWPGG